MLTPKLYTDLSNLVSANGGRMLTSPIDFVKSHHLPGWYESVREYTPETIFFGNEADAVSGADKSNWDRFFVKDFVKSNYSERGSVANSASEVRDIINLIKAHRGEIEGGIALREVESLVDESEVRYFVFNGKPYSPNGIVPAVVFEIAARHLAPFFSVDIVKRADGELRLVEIGDGQVSDRKNWDSDLFCRLLLENLRCFP
ncbi:ATP-grasp domain-containing protein [Oleiphilus messinensis]|nr:ATP-grasp domain-containing protein [Oleiphilus messinensis]